MYESNRKSNLYYSEVLRSSLQLAKAQIFEVGTGLTIGEFTRTGFLEIDNNFINFRTIGPMTNEQDKTESINPTDDTGATIDAATVGNPIEVSSVTTKRRRRDHGTDYRTANDAITTGGKAGKRRRSASNISQVEASSTAVALRNSNESSTSGFLQTSYPSNGMFRTIVTLFSVPYHMSTNKYHHNFFS
jgi:hypothetical protein